MVERWRGAETLERGNGLKGKTKGRAEGVGSKKEGMKKKGRGLEGDQAEGGGGGAKRGGKRAGGG